MLVVVSNTAACPKPLASMYASTTRVLLMFTRRALEMLPNTPMGADTCRPNPAATPPVSVRETRVFLANASDAVKVLSRSCQE